MIQLMPSTSPTASATGAFASRALPCTLSRVRLKTSSESRTEDWPGNRSQVPARASPKRLADGIGLIREPRTAARQQPRDLRGQSSLYGLSRAGADVEITITMLVGSLYASQLAGRTQPATGPAASSTPGSTATPRDPTSCGNQ
jgi:hypothetical protein